MLIVPVLAQLGILSEPSVDGNEVAAVASAVPATRVSPTWPGAQETTPSPVPDLSPGTRPRGQDGSASVKVLGGGEVSDRSISSTNSKSAGGSSVAAGSGRSSGGSPSSGSKTDSGSKTSSQAGGASARPTPSPTKQQVVTVPGIRIRGHQSNRCVTVTGAQGGIGHDGTRLEIRDCDGRAWQKWDFRSDGTVRALGMCMDLAGAGTGNGTPIQLARCNGGWAQQISLNSAYDLVNHHADKCIDVVDKGTANGTKLQLWTCYGTSNQKWSKY
ncbi:ricin-type beta-trefoil lectin domain protein [Actinacidiphila glaucinigra]|uniref:ricin-type beta-trefoil lectin domain protein n=1 Tax=Actinacidiphila glaucinigra TaxID=235986 RepID=UPI0035DF88F8